MRPGGTPEPLGDELARPQLVERLMARFAHSVTCVIGGAGFGKSTSVAQAVRHNEAHPMGVEVWVSCRPGDEDAEQLGTRLLELLDQLAAVDEAGLLGPRTRSTETRSTEARSGWAPAPAATTRDAELWSESGTSARARPTVVAELVERAIVGRSPIDVSIVVDDVHLIAAGSSGEHLLSDVIRRLPDNGHVVLVSRSVPTLPLARLRAAGQVLDIGEHDLAFTEAEVHALARSVGRRQRTRRGAGHDLFDDHDDLDDEHRLDDLARLGGWPALVRLGLIAPRGAHRDFLVEEVLGSLDELQRSTLFALALLGPADDDAVSHVVGRNVTTSDVLRGVPLVARTRGDRHAAHQLWDAAVLASFAGDEHRSMYTRAIDRLMADGQPARAAQAALAIGDVDALDHISLEVVRAHISQIPVDTVRPWLAAAPPERGPAMRMLEAMVAFTDDARDEQVDVALDDVMTLAKQRDDLRLESTALAAAAVIAHARQDMDRLFPLAIRAGELDSDGDPVLELMRAALPAISADLNGDPEGVLHAVRDVQWSRLPIEAVQLMGRLYLQASWLAGRASDTVAFAERWYGGVDSYLGGLPHLSRWLAGSPDAALQSGIGMDRGESMNDRDRLVGSCLDTMIICSRGGADEVEKLWGDGELADLAFDNARDHAHLTYSAAARLVVIGDEEAAAERYQRHLDRWGLDPLGLCHLRRFPALGHVLSPTLRALWDGVALGPTHEAACVSSRALVQLRSGGVPNDIPAAPALVTHVPLPWSVEIAIRLCSLGDQRGLPLFQGIVQVVGSVAIDELNRRAQHGPGHLAGARALAAQLPRVPVHLTSVGCLGPQEVRHGDTIHDGAELRRARVRQLLALLVIERQVTRDRVYELLWPDLSPDSAGNNLRGTLSHLRKLLEPDRPAGSDGYHLRVDTTTIRLVGSPHLVVDAWEADDLEQRIDRTSDLAIERELLRALADLWRGPPFTDLDDIAELGGAVERVRRRHVECLLRLGELDIAAGGARSAKQSAMRALDVDPYCEQAHRLSIAADLRLDDAGAVRRSVARLSTAMEELGVEASPATRMLLQRAARRTRVAV